jgi:anti-anti-sigma factor
MHQSVVIQRLPQRLVIRFVDLIKLSPITLKELQEQIIELLQNDESDWVIVNLEKINMLSSQTLNVLLHMQVALKDRPHKIRLCHLSHDAKEVFQITRTEKFFEVYPNEEAAINCI